MKKVFLLPLGLASTLLFQQAHAGEIVLGASAFNGTLTTEYTQNVVGTNIKWAETGESSEFGGGAFLGYVWNVNSGFDMGFEVFYDYINVTTQASLITDQPIDEQVSGIYGIRTTPGFKITNNTKLYIQLGWAMVSQTLDDKNPEGSSQKDSSSGFLYGAGLQTMIYDNVSLRVFYMVVDDLASSKVDNVDFGTFNATPTVSEFGMSLAYHFKM